jgi:hypothetical protein
MFLAKLTFKTEAKILNLSFLQLASEHRIGQYLFHYESAEMILVSLVM